LTIAPNLVCAQVELSVVEKQDERLARAELHALRAQISSHFIYNALAAVAGHIHANPAEARELLTDFAEFTRYLLRDRRSYVTLGEELEHVRRYLRLEKARLRGRLHVIADVEPAALSVIVPTLSIQPLVENAVQHGVECRVGTGRVEITAKIIASDMQLQVSDKGNGIEADRIPEVLAGTGGGVGLANVNARLRATFGERYALRIKSTPGEGTTAVITVPRLHAQARAAARMTRAGGVARRHQGQTPAPRPEKPAADFARHPARPRALAIGEMNRPRSPGV
jgi:two-component system, LytTR family, sensor kinase